MKVVHLTTVHVPFDTRIFEKMCKTARDLGHEVTLVAPHPRSEVIDGVRIRGVTVPKSRLLRATVGGMRVAGAAWRERGDIYQFHDPELILWAQIFRLSGRCVLYDMHENVPKAVTSKQWIPARLRHPAAGAWRGLERVCLWRVPVLFAEDSYAEDYRWLRNHEVVMNMPKAAGLLRLRARQFERPTVGYLGRVAPERGSSVTLRSLKQLQDEGLRVDFLCIGPASASHRKDLEAAARAWGLQGVRLTGFMRPQAAWAEIARCHAGLAVLADVPNYVDSYPTKMFEYMALGLPVIVSDFPRYRRIVQEARCGLWVDPADATALAGAIRWLLEHPDQARTMGENGRRAVRERYSWEHEAQKLTAFYQRVLEPGGRGGP